MEGKRDFFFKKKREREDTAEVQMSSVLTCLRTCLCSGLFLNVKMKTPSLSLIISLERRCPAETLCLQFSVLPGER